jgi:hypothetical protein
MDDGRLCSICCSLLKHAVAILLLRLLSKKAVVELRGGGSSSSLLPEPIWRHGGAGAGGPCAVGKPRAVQGRTAPKRGLLSFRLGSRVCVVSETIVFFVRAKPTWFPNVPLLKDGPRDALAGIQSIPTCD